MRRQSSSRNRRLADLARIATIAAVLSAGPVVAQDGDAPAAEPVAAADVSPEAGAASAAALAEAREMLAVGEADEALAALREALGHDPENVEARRELGTLYLRTGALGPAEDEIAWVAETAPSPDVLDLLAEIRLQSGRARLAAETLGEAAEGETPARLALRGAVALSRNRLGEAERWYGAALAAEPENRRAELGLARVEFARGDVEAARRRATALLSRAPDYAPGWALRGEVALAARDGGAALGYLDRAVEAAPNDVGLRAARALALLALDKVPAAEKQARALREAAPESPVAFHVAAAAAYADDEPEAAAEALAQLFSRYPEYRAATPLNAFVKVALGELEAAEALMRAWLRDAPNDPSARRALGALLLRMDRPAEAAVLLEEAEAPAGAERRLLASAQVRAGDFDDAAALFQEIRAEETADGRVGGDALTALETPFMLATPQPPQTVAQEFAHRTLQVLDHLAMDEPEAARAQLDALIEADPENPVLHDLLGDLLRAEGDISGARASFERALALDPDFAPALDNLFALDQLDGRDGAALERLEALLRDNPDSDALAMRAAQGYLAAGRVEDAVTLLKGRVDDSPGDDALGRAYIRLLLRADRRDEAVKAIKRLSVNDDRDLGTLVFAANALLDAGAARDAMAAARRVTALAPEEPRAHLLVARAQLAADDLEGAQRTLEAVFDPRITALGGGLIDLAALTGDRAGGMSTGERLAQRHPRTSARQRADMLRRMDDPETAAALLEEAMETTPTSAIAVDLFAVRRQLGRAEAAMTGLDAWLAERPGDPVALRVKGAALIEDGDLEGAETALRAAIAAAPEDPGALNNLAWVLAELGGVDALATAQRAYRAAPGSPQVAATLGRVLFERGQPERGLALLALAAAAAPENPDVLVAYAAALKASGDASGARERLAVALDRPDDFPSRARAEQLAEELE